METPDTNPWLKPVFTVDDLAKLLGCSRKAIYAKHERGQLPGAFRIGRRLHFNAKLLLAGLKPSRGN